MRRWEKRQVIWWGVHYRFFIFHGKHLPTAERIGFHGNENVIIEHLKNH